MMLDHYQQTKNLPVSYSPKKLGFSKASTCQPCKSLLPGLGPWRRESAAPLFFISVTSSAHCLRTEQFNIGMGALGFAKLSLALHCGIAKPGRSHCSALTMV
jgi:hypothetical protein